MALFKGHLLASCTRGGSNDPLIVSHWCAIWTQLYVPLVWMLEHKVNRAATNIPGT